eukprot:symbB.v1.2.022420.t2/scaffold1989.1/size93477/8
MIGWVAISLVMAATVATLATAPVPGALVVLQLRMSGGQAKAGCCYSANSGLIGWMLYALGCFLCLCFGPVGPLFWFVVAGMHYCKPREVRENLPQEAQVARVSLMTAIGSTCMMLTLFMLLVFVVYPNSSQFQGPFACEEPCADWAMSSSSSEVVVCLNRVTKRCAKPNRQRCWDDKTLCRQTRDVATSTSCPRSCESFSGFASRSDLQVCFNNATAVCLEVTYAGCAVGEITCGPI